MCLIPVGTVQRETLEGESTAWSRKTEQPLQMFLDTRQELYRMQTPSLRISQRNALEPTEGADFGGGVSFKQSAAPVDGLEHFLAEWMCLWTSILKALEAGGWLGHLPLQLTTSVPPKGKKKIKKKPLR